MRLTVRDVSRFLGTTESNVLRWIRDRGLPCQQVSGQYRFNRVELLEWATANRLKVSVEAFDRLDPDDEPPASLAAALELGGIVHGLEGDSKPEVLRALVERLPMPEDADRALLLRLYLARESQASTAIGNGVALPHVRNPVVLAVEEPSVTLCFLAHPIDFGALDGKPVSVLFSLICPTIKSHLQMLARLSFAIHEPGFRDVLAIEAANSAILTEARKIDQMLAASNHQAGR